MGMICFSLERRRADGMMEDGQEDGHGWAGDQDEHWPPKKNLVLFVDQQT